MEKKYCPDCDGRALCPPTCEHNAGRAKQFCRIHGGGRVCAGEGCCTSVDVAGAFCTTCSPRPNRWSRTKEIRVAGCLESWRDAGAIPAFIWDRQNLDVDPAQCGRYRPDFVWETATGVVILEVDEGQHADYPLRCELARMLAVTVGKKGLPVHWLRFNPDAFHVDGSLVKASSTHRYDVLKARLMTALASPDYDHLFNIEYLFYDAPGAPGTAYAALDVANEGEVQLVQLADMDAYYEWCETREVSLGA